MELALGIVDIVLSVFIIIVVLFQSGKNAQLSGTIAGGAETFFGKNKGKKMDAVLSKATTIIGLIFVIITLILNAIMIVK